MMLCGVFCGKRARLWCGGGDAMMGCRLSDMYYRLFVLTDGVIWYGKRYTVIPYHKYWSVLSGTYRGVPGTAGTQHSVKSKSSIRHPSIPATLK